MFQKYFMPITPRDREPLELEIEKEKIAPPEKEGPLPRGAEKAPIPQEKAEKPAALPKVVSKPSVVPQALAKSQILEAIERVLAEDLEDVYVQLPGDKKQEFRQKGEETASKIEKILEKAKFKVKEILVLIKNWLRIIPGVNRFFLEQESKIKTDKILKLKK